METDQRVMQGGLTMIQRVAICFPAGVVGALAILLSSHVLFQLGLNAILQVKGPIPFPIPLKTPGIYQPLFWGGLWGIPFGLFIKTAWNRLYLFGVFYFLAPILATFLIFLPLGGAGYFGLKQGGPMFIVYLLLINLPFGIVIAWVAKAIIGKKP
jgi:hypothetical protein